MDANVCVELKKFPFSQIISGSFRPLLAAQSNDPSVPSSVDHMEGPFLPRCAEMKPTRTA